MTFAGDPLDQAAHPAYRERSRPKQASFRSRQWNRLETLDKIQMAHDAFAAWHRVRKTQNIAVFLSALLLQKHWSR